MTGANILGGSDRPLFFKLADPAAIGVPPPVRRAGGEAIRLLVRSVSAMQKEALVVSARTGAAWRLASDEGAYLAGHDAAPCPLSFFSTGMVAATQNEIQALARRRGIAIRRIRLIQDNYYTMKGSALRGTMFGGARDVELEAQIDADGGRDALYALVCDAVAAAPFAGLMRQPRDSLFTLTHNGREIAPGKATPLGQPAEPDPGDRFDRATPAPGDWSGLIRRAGMTPETEETTTRAGGSLQDSQDRTLHVRVICSPRDDGVKRIEQHLYNPHGSIFHFLSDEAPEAGGHGLAPDAASYLSAGIGFCFMTQFGRYAAIARKDLRAYRIVQDTHFAPGGASGGSGQPGETDPVETHVHLETGEDDGFARTLLDMGEQTCFLHAFCRTALKTRVRIADLAPHGSP